ncbi:unnamed protein product [Rhizophagus irregularis]|uniref:Uncharacterized protein n=1 Tax=Rhizophagus irregularis TaxID=588596 RepID=A0A915Z8C1_9GLOM|nr:unnamed protein product [Rhizophagus irregularis]CAB5364689.1 unnamed protein product [Rhizophagus irregularis]
MNSSRTIHSIIILTFLVGVSPRADHTPKLIHTDKTFSEKKKKENVKVWVTLPSPSRKPRKHRISLRYTPITLIPKVKEKSLSDT